MNRTQRWAKHALVGLCAILAVGVGGAVAGRMLDPTAPAVRFVDADGNVGAATAVAGMDRVAPAAEATLLAADGVEAEAEGHPKVLWMEVTAYCACEKCCGKHSPGITASGRKVTFNEGHFVAADTDVLPFGTHLSIPGYADGQAVPVLDRGGAIKGHKLDVFFADHDQAKAWGRRKLAVTVVEVP